jgi:septal ring factor EnvC (AmiA/AmiB activator)
MKCVVAYAGGETKRKCRREMRRRRENNAKLSVNNVASKYLQPHRAECPSPLPDSAASAGGHLEISVAGGVGATQGGTRDARLRSRGVMVSSGAGEALEMEK